jgi:hypothetical protein
MLGRGSSPPFSYCATLALIVKYFNTLHFTTSFVLTYWLLLFSFLIRFRSNLFALLDQEFETYWKNREWLVSEHPRGGFVVIWGNDILRVYQSRQEALQDGISRFGNVSFLVRNLNEEENVANFSRNLSFA